MKEFGILITATPLSSFAYIMQLSSTDYVDTVGDMESSFDMQYLCLFPPATVSPLILTNIFCFRSM